MVSPSRIETQIDEVARLVAAKSTKQIALYRGRAFGMYLGCGYPKSGTVWLCQLLSTALGLPHPRHYRFPIAMSSIIHAHWSYNRRLPPTAYIRRDGRDVMVSLYFHNVRVLSDPTKPRRAEALRQEFTRLYGRGFDPYAIRDNLPRFIEYVTATPRGTDRLAWHQHIQDWWDRPQAALLTYEELHNSPVATITRVMGDLGVEPNEHIATLAVDRWSFANTAGRNPGEEDRTSFQRKGVTGDWMNHFSREAGEVFDAVSGDTLTALGYTENRDWYRQL